MNEEERKTILELASLSKQLKKQLKKFLGKTEIKIRIKNELSLYFLSNCQW